METNRGKSKRIPIAEIIGAIAAVTQLCMQLFWSKEYEPELRKVTEIISLILVAVTAVLLASKVEKRKKR